MHYHDALYGDVSLPDVIGELADTPEVQRLHHISQDTIPRKCIPWGAVSRFEHSMGVCSLSTLVLQRNPLPEREARLLPIAALLHDAGNPCFSHLTEPFLKELTGKDGESFLEETLHNTTADAILDAEGFSLEEVVRWVTGYAKPLSLVLNGTMDIDNLDNVNRYWFTARNGEILFDAPSIASSFIFNQTTQAWELDDRCFAETEKWQDARGKVYGLVYGDPHQNACMMLYRAVAIAFARGEIQKWFFHLTDNEALEYLGSQCNPNSSRLAKRVAYRVWHKEVFSIETTAPSPRLRKFCEPWDARTIIADHLCKELHLPLRAICAYVGKGKDKRRIELPFVDKHGVRRFDHDRHDPIYRVKIYIDPEFEITEEEIERSVRCIIS